jgi:hypothetical protein
MNCPYCQFTVYSNEMNLRAGSIGDWVCIPCGVSCGKPRSDNGQWDRETRRDIGPMRGNSWAHVPEGVLIVRREEAVK